MHIDPVAAFRDHMAIKQKVHEATIMYEFMQETKFPAAVRGRYFDMKELNSDEKQEAAFRQAYPGFPYIVGIVPASMSRKFNGITNLLGRAGDLGRVYDGLCTRYSLLLKEYVPILLFRLPRMKSLYVASVTLRDKPLGFQITLPSEAGYFITLESLADFMRHPTGDDIRDYLSNAVSGAY